MTDSAKPDGFTLKRWSQRKLAASRAAQPPAPTEIAAPAVAAPVDAPRADAAVGEALPLPPIESLTIDSDFTPFLRPDIDETVRRGALRKLFSDPHFNVMDGLDVYIEDFSKPDPLSPEIARSLVQARYIFDPPKTRVNAQGHVEDVPPEELEGEALADAGRASAQSSADAMPAANVDDSAMTADSSSQAKPAALPAEDAGATAAAAEPPSVTPPVGAIPLAAAAAPIVALPVPDRASRAADREPLPGASVAHSDPR